jgi:hypothetical protein
MHHRAAKVSLRPLTYQLPGNSEITQLNIATLVQKDVAGLDISKKSIKIFESRLEIFAEFSSPVNDLQLFFQIVKSVKCRDSDLSENIFRYSLLLALTDVLIELVQRGRHDFHSNPAVALFENGPVKLNNIAAVV